MSTGGDLRAAEKVAIWAAEKDTAELLLTLHEILPRLWQPINEFDVMDPIDTAVIYKKAVKALHPMGNKDLSKADDATRNLTPHVLSALNHAAKNQGKNNLRTKIQEQHDELLYAREVITETHFHLADEVTEHAHTKMQADILQDKAEVDLHCLINTLASVLQEKEADLCILTERHTLQLELKHKDFTELEEECVEKDNRIVELEKRVAELEKGAPTMVEKTIINTTNTSNTSNTSHAEELERLTNDLKIMSIKAQASQEEVAELQKMMSVKAQAHEEEVAELRKALHRVKKELDISQNENREALTRLKQDLEEAQNETRNLKKQAQSREDEYDDERRQLQKAKKLVEEDFAEALAKKEKELKEMMDSLERLRKENLDLEEREKKGRVKAQVKLCDPHSNPS